VYETTNVGGVPGDKTGFLYLGRHLIAERKKGSALTYVHSDALGSVTRKTDASGARVQDRVYEPFGESLEVTTRAPQWPQGVAYTAHPPDAARLSGLIRVVGTRSSPTLRLRAVNRRSRS